MKTLIHFIYIKKIFRFTVLRRETIIEVDMDYKDDIDKLIDKAKVKLCQCNIQIKYNEVNLTVL